MINNLHFSQLFIQRVLTHDCPQGSDITHFTGILLCNLQISICYLTNEYIRPRLHFMVFFGSLFFRRMYFVNYSMDVSPYSYLCLPMDDASSVCRNFFFLQYLKICFVTTWIKAVPVISLPNRLLKVKFHLIKYTYLCIAQNGLHTYLKLEDS